MRGIAIVYCIPQTVLHIPDTISHIRLKNVSDINIILYCITIHGYISLLENTYINPIYLFTVIVGQTVNVGNILPYIFWSSFLMSEVPVHDMDINVLKRPDCRLWKCSDQSTVVDANWLDLDVISPVLPHAIPSMPDIMLDVAGVHLPENHNSDEVRITLCKSCHSSIKSRHVPSFSLANHMVLGAVPPQLKDLTVVEEAMIAKC